MDALYKCKMCIELELAAGTSIMRVHNDPSRSCKVVDFGTNRKCVLDFLLLLNSNLSAILSRFRDIRAFVCRKPLFPHPTPIPDKI